MLNNLHLRILQKFLLGFLCCLGLCSIVYAQHKSSTDVISVRAPVWTEELGNVPLDKYAQEELSQMVRDFWTPERMKSAVPVELKNSPNPAQEDFPPNHHNTKESAEVILSLPASMDYRNEHKNKTISDPKNPNGKIYYYNHSTGVYHYCSGSSVNSESKRIVATAGHCVHGGMGNTWHSNWYFYPDYSEGQAPYGGFPAVIYWVLPDWVNQFPWYQGIHSDIAFVTTDTNHQNLRVVEAVGGHGIMHGGSYNFHATIWGYPQILGGGQQLWSCSGNTAQLWQSGYAFVSSNWCHFSEGASGGPWLYQYDPITKEGILRGVSSWVFCRNSSIPCNNVKNLNSPYFSDNVINLFNNANSADW